MKVKVTKWIPSFSCLDLTAISQREKKKFRKKVSFKQFFCRVPSTILDGLRLVRFYWSEYVCAIIDIRDGELNSF